MNLRFPKAEKLKSRKLIEQLFDEGDSFVAFPVKLFALPLENVTASQATFAVPKRNFKTAVSRNRVKRQLRECYRLHKEVLLSNNGAHYALLFLYISKDNPQYAQLEDSIQVLLTKLEQKK